MRAPIAPRWQQGIRGSIYEADTDATYADEGACATEGLRCAHVGGIVAVEGENGELSMGIECAGDGCGERGMEGAAGLGAERDVRFKCFRATKDISYSTCGALYNAVRGVGIGRIEWIHTALPSLLPTSVEVLRKKRGRSRVVKITSTSPGFAAGSADGSKRAWTDWKRSV